MSKSETAADRLKRMKREREAAMAREEAEPDKLIEQLAHEGDGQPDFSELAKKLEERKAQAARGENEGYIKMTIYIEENLAKAFNALITKRGQQKEFANQAIRDFVQKKARELDI